MWLLNCTSCTIYCRFTLMAVQKRAHALSNLAVLYEVSRLFTRTQKNNENPTSDAQQQSLAERTHMWRGSNSCGLTRSWNKLNNRRKKKQLHKVQNPGGTGLAKTVKWNYKEKKPFTRSNTDTKSIVCSSALNHSEAAVGGLEVMEASVSCLTLFTDLSVKFVNLLRIYRHQTHTQGA